MVYKLVEVDGIPVEKRSARKESHGGRKAALRLSRSTGTVAEERSCIPRASGRSMRRIPSCRGC